MKKVRLYTRLKGDTYYIMDESSDEIYATVCNNIFAEVIRKALEDHINEL